MSRSPSLVQGCTTPVASIRGLPFGSLGYHFHPVEQTSKGGALTDFEEITGFSTKSQLYPLEEQPKEPSLWCPFRETIEIFSVSPVSVPTCPNWTSGGVSASQCPLSQRFLSYSDHFPQCSLVPPLHNLCSTFLLFLVLLSFQYWLLPPTEANWDQLRIVKRKRDAGDVGQKRNGGTESKRENKRTLGERRLHWSGYQEKNRNTESYF